MLGTMAIIFVVLLAIGAVYVVLNLAILLRGGEVQQAEASTMID